jgi:alkylation response protein AidB-like acyl-CoA dehydrogenase
MSNESAVLESRRQIRSELLEAANKIRSTVRDSAPASEQARRLAPQAVDALERSGLLRLCWPKELGGHAADATTCIEVIEEVSSMDPAAGWNLGVGSLHTGFVGAYAGQGCVDAVFSGGQAIVAGQVAPVGRATSETGGLRVDGAWSFGSGIHQSQWVIGGVVVTDGDTNVPKLVVMPRADVEIVDNWHVAGLEGTGSCDYRTAGTFVPDDFSFAFPMPNPQRGGAVYRASLLSQAMVLHVGFALGCARLALEEITALARTKKRMGSSSSVATRATFQRDLGEALSALQAARAYARQVGDRLTLACESQEPLTPQFDLDARRCATWVTDRCVEIVASAYRAGGSSSLFLDHPLQRVSRCLQAATQHVYVDDQAYVLSAQHQLDEEAQA